MRGLSRPPSPPKPRPVESILDQMLGADAPVTVEYEAGGGALLEGRYRNSDRMREATPLSEAWTSSSSSTHAPIRPSAVGRPRLLADQSGT